MPEENKGSDESRSLHRRIPYNETVNRVSILGIPTDAVAHEEALRQIASFFRQEGHFHIATPNPEMLVEAQKNEKFRRVLQETDLNLPDGVGLVWAMKRVARLSEPRFERVTGTDILQALCATHTRLCPPETVFFLGAALGVAEKAAEILHAKNPALNIVGTFAGSPKKEDEEEIIRRINTTSPTLLFVAYGAPAQDLWISRNLKKLQTVKVAMSVGGAFDFIVGKQKRAPQLLRKIGLEWLWRLMLEPRRLKRIWNAVIVFPWLVLRCHAEEAA